MLQSNENKVETSYLFVTKVFENSLIFKPNFKLGKPEKCSCCLQKTYLANISNSIMIYNNFKYA